MSERQINLTGDEFDSALAIVVNGIEYDIGVRVHRWDEKSGFNGYKTPKRYSRRKGADRPIDCIKQVMLHHGGGDRKNPGVMFHVMWNDREVSATSAFEDNGEIWQFVDVIEKTWHGSKMNHTAIGGELCLFPEAWKNPNYYSEKRNKRIGNLPHRIIEQPVHGTIRKVFAITDEQHDAMCRFYAGCWFAVGHQRTEGFSGHFDRPPIFPRVDGEIPWSQIEDPVEHIGYIAHRHSSGVKVDKNTGRKRPGKWDPAGVDFLAVERDTSDYYRSFRSAYGK